MEYDHEKERPPIDLNWDIKDLVAFMCEGNLGGLSVMMHMLREGDVGEAMHAILLMDDMNIRGPQIWVAFKYACKGNIEELKERLKKRDPTLIEYINTELGEDYPWVATTIGASFKRSNFYKGDKNERVSSSRKKYDFASTGESSEG